MARFVWSLLVLVAACRPATQVTVDVTTDVDCAATRGTSVAVGEPGAVDGKPAGGQTSECSNANAAVHDIGSIVLVPNDGEEAFGLNVVLGVDRPPDDCKAAGYDGCIVARRAMSFVAHTELFLPISLAERCKGIACSATTTCVDGECVDAKIRDPEQCTDKNACDDTSLGGMGSGGAGGAGGSGNAGGRGGGGAGGSPPATCGGPGVLIDDFESPATGSGWVVEGYGSVVSEAGGVLTLAPKDTLMANYVEYRSRYAVDLTGRAMRVTVPKVGLGSDQRTSLLLGFDDGTGAWITFLGGQLLMALRQGVLPVGVPVSVPYDSSAHRVWQLREQGGMLEWQTSPDGSAWTTHHSQPMPGFLIPAYMRLRTGATLGTLTTPAELDDFNAGVPPEAWCPISTFSDGFDDGVVGPAWWPSTANGGCQMSEVGGVVTMSAASGGACERRSAGAFDLNESGIVLEIASFPDPAGDATAFFDLTNAAGDVIRLAQQGNSIQFAITGGSAGNTGTDPAWKFWRIQHSSPGLLSFGGSADGLVWNDSFSVNTQLSGLEAVDVGFGLVKSAGSPGYDTFGVSAVNP